MQLERLWPTGPGPLPWRAGQVLAALRRAETPTPAWAPRFRVVTDRSQLTALVTDARAEVHTGVTEHRQYRHDRWHAWCNDPKQLKKVFRYIRQGPMLHKAPPATGWNGHAPGRASELVVAALAAERHRPAAGAMAAGARPPSCFSSD